LKDAIEFRETGLYFLALGGRFYFMAELVERRPPIGAFSQDFQHRELELQRYSSPKDAWSGPF